MNRRRDTHVTPVGLNIKNGTYRKMRNSSLCWSTIAVWAIWAHPVQAQIRAHYALDEGSGTTAVDSADGFDGTVQGATWGTSAEAKEGNSCLIFGASGDALSVPSGTIDAMPTGTFMCWIYPTGNFNSGPSTGTSQYYIVSKQVAGVIALFDVWLDFNGKIRTNIGGADPYPGSVCSVQLNEWNHIAITWDGTIKKVYVNGVFDSSGGTAFVGNSPNTTYIGRNVTHVNDRFIGRIDGIQILDRTFSGVTIATCAGLPPLDRDCDGIPDSLDDCPFDPTNTKTPDGQCIPTVSQWGLLVMAGLVAAAGGRIVAKRRRAASI